MAVAGRKPKPDGEKRNKTKPSIDWQEVVDVPYGGPKPHPGYDLPWESRYLWEALSTMPHCVLWEAADWRIAIDTIRLHAVLADSDYSIVNVASEVRRRLYSLGASWDARLDLRIRYVSQLTPDVENAPILLAERRNAAFG